VAQKVGKSVSLVEGLLNRRLRRSETMTTKKATRVETEEIIHNEIMEEEVEESAWIDGMR
jgi:hypothetical protein